MGRRSTNSLPGEPIKTPLSSHTICRSPTHAAFRPSCISARSISAPARPIRAPGDLFNKVCFLYASCAACTENPFFLTFSQLADQPPQVDEIELVSGYRTIDFGTVGPDYGDEDPNSEHY
jgi:hypothetical protein